MFYESRSSYALQPIISSSRTVLAIKQYLKVSGALIYKIKWDVSCAITNLQDIYFI